MAAEPAEEERLPPPAAFRASQEIANRNFCDDDDDEDDHAAGSFATSESLVREALCGRIDPPPAGPLTARSELSEATTARAPSRESSPRDAVRTVSFDAPPPRHRPQSGRPPRPVTAEAVSRALRRARGGYVDDADDEDGASDDEDPDPVAPAPDAETNVRPPDPAQRMRLVEMEIPSFAERFPFAPDSPVQERRAARPSTAGPGAAGRAPTFAVARRPATAGPRRRRRSEDALACLRAPLDLSLCDFLDDLVNLCDAAEAAEKRRTA